MKPIRTRKTTGIYGAPPGLSNQIGGLPYYREPVAEIGGTEVVSVWAFTPEEREWIGRGANLVLGILGREPISPVSLSLRDGEWFEEIPEPEAPRVHSAECRAIGGGPGHDYCHCYCHETA